MNHDLSRLRTANVKRRPKVVLQPQIGFSTRVSSKSLPIISSVQQNSRLQSLFQTVLECASNFLTHNIESVSFYSTISSQIGLIEKAFNDFFSNLSRGSYLPEKFKLNPQGNSCKPLRDTAEAFFVEWKKFEDQIGIVKESGVLPILENMEKNFQIIEETLKAVSDLMVEFPANDYRLKKCKSLSESIVFMHSSVKALVSKELGKENHGRLTSEMRLFSRTLNSAFRNEFSTLIRTPSDNDNVRNKAFNSCSDIIYAMKAMIVFDTDVENLIRRIDAFKKLLDTIAQIYGLSFINENEIEFSNNGQGFPNSIKLSEAIENCHKLISRGKYSQEEMDSLFEELVLRAQKLENENETKTNLKTDIFQIESNDFQDLIENSIVEMSDIVGSSIPRFGEMDTNETIRLYNDLFQKSINKKNILVLSEIMKAFSVKQIDELLLKITEFSKYQEKFAEETQNNTILAIINGCNIDADISTELSVDVCCNMINSQLEDARNEQSNKIILLSKQLNELFKTNMDDPLPDQIKSVFKLYNSKQTSLNVFQESSNRIEQRLRMILNIEKSGEPVLSQIDSYIDIIKAKIEQTITDSPSYKTLSQIYTRILRVSGQNSNINLNVGSDYLVQINSALDKAEESLQSCQKSQRKFQKDNISTKAMLEMIEKKLSRFLKIPVSQPDQARDIQDILATILAICDSLDKQAERTGSLSRSDLVFIIGDEKRLENPLQFIQQLFNQNAVFQNSIQCLQEINEIFDNIIRSMDSKNEKFSTITDQSQALQRKYNSIAPQKIDATVFTTISRFVAILSSLIPLVSILSNN